MIKRTIEISSTPAKVLLDLGRIVITAEGRDDVFVPIEDLGVLILANRQSVISAAALDACARANVAVVICDQRFTPSALLQPLNGHSLQAKTVDMQMKVSEPRKKNIWMSVIRAKISGQAKTLEQAGVESKAMRAWAKQVRSGDPGNLEGRAAAWYWPRLFGQKFIRSRDGKPPNSLLNYGYAILRASVARSLVGAGLHPSFGIHHSNQYNAFLLADDLMEPLRPIVDREVYLIWKDNTDADVDRESKAKLLGILGRDLIVDKKTAPFDVALARYTASFRRALEEKGMVNIPTW